MMRYKLAENGLVDDFENFPRSHTGRHFALFLYSVSNLKGKTAAHAKCLCSFLQRQQRHYNAKVAVGVTKGKGGGVEGFSKPSLTAPNSSTLNICLDGASLKPKLSSNIYEERMKVTKSEPSVHSANCILKGTPTKDLGTPKHTTSEYIESNHGQLNGSDPHTNKADEGALKRSASVELFPNFDRYEDHALKLSGNLQDTDKSSVIAKSPVVSVKQSVKQFVKEEPFYNYNDETLSFDKLLFKQKQMEESFRSFIQRSDEEEEEVAEQRVLLQVSQKDDCSWLFPPSKTPCFLQYKLAKQFNRNISLPGVIGRDLELESADEKHSIAKADIKRFFARISPLKGTRYTAQSDYLKLYPQCVLELLQGPFGQTAYDNALRFRCLSSGNVYSFSSRNHADELILPPPEAMRPLSLWMGTYGIPRDDKRHRGGEDAWFTSSLLNAMAVADGVSEWMDLVGINPREFAEDLVRGTLNELYTLKEKGLFHSSPPFSPSRLAEQALGNAFKNAKHFGSSTAIVGLLNPSTSTLGIANLGDSGGLILRRSTTCGQLCIVRRVREMQHGFNVPYQFTHLPAPEEWDALKQRGMSRIVKFAENEYRRASAFGKTIGDLPEDIQAFNISVCEGDLIILGSDGLFDNLFDYEITSLTALAVSPREAKLLYHNVNLATSPKDISRSLALLAYWKSLDPQAKTPFAKYSKHYSQNRCLFDFNGGKEDDISVAVAWVALKEDTISDF